MADLRLHVKVYDPNGKLIAIHGGPLGRYAFAPDPTVVGYYVVDIREAIQVEPGPEGSDG